MTTQTTFPTLANEIVSFLDPKTKAEASFHFNEDGVPTVLFLYTYVGSVMVMATERSEALVVKKFQQMEESGVEPTYRSISR